MEAIILAGGFATRLRPLSEYIPKPLFPLGGVPLINFVLQKVWEVKPERIIVSTNRRFENHFRYWMYTLPHYIAERTELITEPTRSNDEKFGALGGLHHSIKEAGVRNDVFVVAGDNLFDFDLRRIVRKGREKGITLAAYDVENIELAKRYGVLVLDGDRVIEFQEKPEHPKSTNVSTGIYFFPEEKTALLEEYIRSESDTDALGRFFEWIVNREQVFAEVYTGTWFDIGTLDTYKQADEYITNLGWNRRWLWP